MLLFKRFVYCFIAKAFFRKRFSQIQFPLNYDRRNHVFHLIKSSNPFPFSGGKAHNCLIIIRFKYGFGLGPFGIGSLDIKFELNGSGSSIDALEPTSIT